MVVATRTVVVCSSVAVAAALIWYCSCYYSSARARRRRKHDYPWAEAISVDYKPQCAFTVVLTDNSSRSFVHLQRGNSSESGQLHPYHHEISTLAERLEKPPLVVSTETGPPPMTEHYVWIETKEELAKLAHALSQVQEFAVDTEQHSVRSFLGFTALLQVSTRKEDFLIDTIALHDDMCILRSVFADSNIRKVFHGGDGDSLWLQRDFHIYIVNLFDTARACEILAKPQRSLAYLLQTYCGIATNKIFQRADWRLRPIPEEMIEYARIDAHYLLYIADCLQNELIQDMPGEIHGGNECLFQEVVRRSNLLCLQLYQNDSASSASTASSILSRYRGHPKNKSMDTEGFWRRLCALCDWRDTIARCEDESTRFVLADRAMLALAEDNPASIKEILSIISMADEAFPTEVTQYSTPLPSPSPVLIENVQSLENVLQHAHTDIGSKQGVSASLWKLFNVFKSAPATHTIEMHERKLGKRVDRRVPRRWRMGDIAASRKRYVQKFSCKAPVYQNCRIYAGDGRLLCFCDRRKIEWYVQKGLAEPLDEDPPAIRLLFEPKGRPEDESNDFYVQSKTNCCVGCGEATHYLRYRLIPSCYRQHFPEHLKSHRSHDIVLLCVDCHEVAHRAAEIHKKKVAAEYGVPLYARRVIDGGTVRGNVAEVQVVDGARGGAPPLQLRTAAIALLQHGPSMPKKRREELEEVVRAYYGGRDITQDDIQAALLVGKGPRQMRRLLKKKGLALDKIFKEGSYRLTPEGDVINLTGQNFVHAKSKIDLGSDTSLAVEDPNSINLVGMPLVEGGVNSSHASVEGLMESNEENFTPQGDADSNEGTFAQGDIDESLLRVTAKDLSSQGYAEELHGHRQRVSLVGHGPHGRKVVEILLEQEGEEGITQFCQRWRAIFVEAVKPTHLPAGWDICHSGRREFGEYSIYNPSKRTAKRVAEIEDSG